MTRRTPSVAALFSVYVVFYSTVAIYGAYLNLYLSSTGLSNLQIGAIVSLSTGFTFFANVFWGEISDRTGDLRRVIMLALLLSLGLVLGYYLHSSFIYLAIISVLFAVCFNPITPLLDAYSLELLEDTQTDYGQIRMGGTIGYSVTVLIAGWFLDDAYGRIFLIAAVLLFLAWLTLKRFPRVEGAVKAPKQAQAMPKDKLLIALLIFNFIFALGTAFYSAFYPIYFESIGGNSRLIGIMLFLGAMSEVPVLIYVGRIIDRIGIKKLLVIASLCTIVRWVLLGFLVNPVAIIAVSLLHGIGFTSFNYGLITYINKSLPRQMRARGQTFYVLLGSVLPRVISGYLGGLATTYIGTNRLVLLNAGLLAVATLVFVFQTFPEEQVAA